MSATPPTREQVAELADAVRTGALDDQQREQLVALLADIAWSVQTCVLAEQRYADSPELYQGWLAACWQSVTGHYAQLLSAVCPDTDN